MLEELSLLVRLQEVDNQLMEIEAEKGDLPEQIDNLQKEITQHVRELETAESSLKSIREEKSSLQRQMEEAKERLKRSQSVLYSVKTTREYDAISAEIEQAKVQLTTTEKRLLELNTAEERFGSAHGDRHKRLELIEKEHAERQREMHDRLDSSQDQELKLRHEREKMVVRIKRPVLSHYERIRKIRDGVGVSQLINGACGYCFSMIPPQRQAEINKMDDMFLCEVCGCIIVADQT